VVDVHCARCCRRDKLYIVGVILGLGIFLKINYITIVFKDEYVMFICSTIVHICRSICSMTGKYGRLLVRIGQ